MSSLLPKPRAGILAPESFKVCGTCEHGVMNVHQMDMLDCCGAPPVPVVVGVAGGPQGAGLNIQAMRPQVQKTTRACGMHKSKLSVLS